MLARNPILQGRLLYPFSVTTVNWNLTWDWTECCSLVLAMRLESEESLRAFSSPATGHNCHLLAAFQEAWAGGKCCVDGGKEITISLHPNPFHYDWGKLGLMGETRPGSFSLCLQVSLSTPLPSSGSYLAAFRNEEQLRLVLFVSQFEICMKRGAARRANRFFFSVRKHPCLCHFAALCQRLTVGFRSRR